MNVGDQVAELEGGLELAVGGEELGVERDPAALVALARAADVVERRADRAGDRLDGEREAVLLGDVEQRRQAVEVPLEVAVAVGELPEVEDDEPGAELAGDAAVEGEAGEGSGSSVESVAPMRLSACAVTIGSPRRSVDDALVPAPVDRELELARAG